MTQGSQAPAPARVNAIRAGLLCRCPACGEGPLFEGFLKLRRRCETCGFDLSAIDTGDGPASFIMQIAGAAVVFPALYVEMTLHPPIWVHLIVWPPLLVGLALSMMRPGKGLMVALTYRNRAGEVRNDDF